MTCLRFICLFGVLCLAATAMAATPPEGTSDAPAAWGPPSAGLAISLTVEGDVAVGGTLRIKVALHSAAGQVISLPAAKEVSGWLLVGQGTGASRKAYYSEKVFPFRQSADWPAELGEGKQVAAAVDVGGSQAFASEDAKKLLAAYLAETQPAAGKPSEELLKPVGPFNRMLTAGRAMAKFTLCLPNPGGPPTVLTSNSVEIVIGPPELAAMPEAERKAFTADLLAQFDRDAWGGLQAHDTAVRLGPAILPAILSAAMETKRPDPARLWLATTLADIRDPRSAQALQKLLDDPLDGVRSVVAFHGPKQNSPDLDKAIIAKATAPKQSGLAAWALLGFMVHRGAAPEELLKAGLESDDPRVRTTVAEALAQHASEANVERLVALLADKDERVRGTAAAMLGKSGVKTRVVIGGLVKSLELPGENARRRIAAALGELTGRSQPYDPAADQAARGKTLADWKTWWVKESAK
jgi:hypothetical protein